MINDKVTPPFTKFLGYDYGEHGNLFINEDQAVSVKPNYSMFLKGMAPIGMAAQLNIDGIRSLVERIVGIQHQFEAS